MNVDAILNAFARHEVDAILIGGMNFLLRHQPVLTFDVDFWVRDSDANLAQTSNALCELRAEWGRDESSWRSVPSGGEWLRAQSVFCLTSPHGAIDIFREVAGLGNYDECRKRCAECQTASGIRYVSLSDEDMLACQTVLAEGERRADRVAFLTNLLNSKK